MPHSSDHSHPLVSIVTVVRNKSTTIAEAIDSVAQQASNLIEYIVIDGDSTDGTREIIRSRANKIHYWESKPDRGVYHAMNKGWNLSRGDYIYFLGADDKLVTLPITELLAAKALDVHLLYGNVVVAPDSLFRSHYGWQLLFNNTLHHQGVFTRRTVTCSEPFDERYKVYGDFDLNQRLYLRKIRVQYVNKIIARFSPGGLSNDRRYSYELFSIIRKNVGWCAMAIAYMAAHSRGLGVRLRRRASQSIFT